MLLSNPAYDTPHGPQERPRCCQGDGETISSPSTGGFPLPLPNNPVRQQPGLRQVQLTAGEEIRDGAGQEDAWLGHCIRPRRGIKEGPACWEEADLGTMETQRASLALGRWSLWLLLLGLVVPSASAQTLSYREAVLHAVDRLNERSSEANLYRLLELDPPPKAVSQEDPGEGAVSRQPWPRCHPLCSGCTSCQEGTSPSRWAPTSSRKPSQNWVPSQHEASCLSISAVGIGALYTLFRLKGLLGAPGIEGGHWL